MGLYLTKILLYRKKTNCKNKKACIKWKKLFKTTYQIKG